MNTPDDYGSGFRTCSRGHRYHLSAVYCADCEAITEGLAAPVPCSCGAMTEAQDWKWQKDGEYWSADCRECGEEVFR